MKKISYTILLLGILLAGCKKDLPPTGDYVGTFDGTYVFQENTYQRFRSHKIAITESNKNNVIFECGGKSSELKKEKENITGTFVTDKYVGSGNNEIDGPITINGMWKKSDKKYIIYGTFSSYYSLYGENDTLEVSGSFEIKSEF